MPGLRRAVPCRAYGVRGRGGRGRSGGTGGAHRCQGSALRRRDAPDVSGPSGRGRRSSDGICGPPHAQSRSTARVGAPAPTSILDEYQTMAAETATTPANAICVFPFQFFGSGHHPPAGLQTHVGYGKRGVAPCAVAREARGDEPRRAGTGRERYGVSDRRLRDRRGRWRSARTHGPRTTAGTRTYHRQPISFVFANVHGSGHRGLLGCAAVRLCNWCGRRLAAFTLNADGHPGRAGHEPLRTRWTRTSTDSNAQTRLIGDWISGVLRPVRRRW